MSMGDRCFFLVSEEYSKWPIFRSCRKGIQFPKGAKMTEYTVTISAWNKLVMEKLSAERTLGEIKKICKVGVQKGNKNYKEEHNRGVRKIAEHILKVIKKLEKSEKKNDI